MKHLDVEKQNQVGKYFSNAQSVVGGGVVVMLIKGKNGYHSRGFEDWEKNRDYAVDDQQPFELYDLTNDFSQKFNLAARHPEVVKELDRRLKSIKSQGHSAPRLIP